jgi:hypothetical protein
LAVLLILIDVDLALLALAYIFTVILVPNLVLRANTFFIAMSS